MFLVEKENFEQQNHFNIDNDFKELDREIDKVIHGEAPYGDEQTEDSNSDNNNSSKHTLNSTEIIDNEKEYTNNINQNLNTIKNKINQKNNKITKTNNLDDKKYINEFPQKLSISNLNSNPNIISSLNYIEEIKGTSNKFNCNYPDCVYENNTQKMKKESFILNNNKLKDDYKNIINSTLNINLINNINNCLGISFKNFNQFNFYNSNECINSNNNKNIFETYNINNINNKNKLFNKNFENEGINNSNQNYIPNLDNIKEQLMIKQKQGILNSKFNNFNQINNNFISINFPIMTSNFNQLSFINYQYQYQNYLILNQINNSNLNNSANLNYCLDNNNNAISEIIKKAENNNIILNKIENQKNIQNNIYKKSKNFYTPHNNNFKISKNDFNNKGINNFNLDNNCYKKKRKIFNPIPDSEKEKNIINLIDIIQNKDTRTTLMIKNIPNKYNISTLLEEINLYFKDTYDILYLPIDFINNCNLGFAFINFVEPLHIILFYELYRGKKWKKFNSEKICELLYAKYQGKKELIDHFEKGQILSFDGEDKKPIILPTPDPLPKINIPHYYLSFFNKLYPNVSYEIKILQNFKNKNDVCSLKKIFSINGKFEKN